MYCLYSRVYVHIARWILNFLFMSEKICNIFFLKMKLFDSIWNTYETSEIILQPNLTIYFFFFFVIHFIDPLGISTFQIDVNSFRLVDCLFVRYCNPSLASIIYFEYFDCSMSKIANPFLYNMYLILQLQFQVVSQGCMQYLHIVVYLIT